MLFCSQCKYLHNLMLLVKTCTLTVPPHPMGTVNMTQILSRGHLLWTSILSREAAILLVISCNGNQIIASLISHLAMHFSLVTINKTIAIP